MRKIRNSATAGGSAWGVCTVQPLLLLGGIWS